MADDKGRGLYSKYRVERQDGKALKGGGAIVLELGDPRAWPAIERYAAEVELAGYVKLAADLRAQVRDRSAGLCPTCDGKGTVYYAPGMPECPACKGSGKELVR